MGSSKKSSPQKQKTAGNGKGTDTGLKFEAKSSPLKQNNDHSPNNPKKSQLIVDLPTTVATISCKHLSSIPEFLRMYGTTISRIASPSNASTCCLSCGRKSDIFYSCIQCGAMGCWHGEEYHLAQHHHETGHALSVESSSGVVFCFLCKAFAWFDHMQNLWMLKDSSEHVIGKYIKRIEDLSLPGSTRHCVGVRGLYNLGNTCFMNSILQCILHTAYLRRYFLSPQGPWHIKNDCAHSKLAENVCIACEMDELFCQSNDGNRTPLAPHRLLEGLWKHATDMAAYEQQDAHEMFINLRNALHTHLNGSMFNCPCIIHSIFSGVLQSDVTCTSCSKVRETFDPFLDISLDIPANSPPLKLTDCLQRFTRTERLHATSYACDNCHRTNQEILKQLSIRSHPKVLTIHLKRFEHGVSSTKIDTKVLFPTIFNISPYMSFDNRDLGHPNQHEYHLYAVVNHNGTLDRGHYTAFVKYRKEWFWIDDACVTHVQESDVYNGNAYMLFYTLSDIVK